MRRLAFIAMATCAASVALAHEGVKNPAVKARMHVMGQISAATKVLGEMAKGEVPFDDQVALRELVKILVESDRIEELFASEETDPKSEALPEIWVDFPDFVRKSKNLQAIVGGGALSVTDIDGLRSTFSQIGSACKDCHKLYRKP